MHKSLVWSGNQSPMQSGKHLKMYSGTGLRLLIESKEESTAIRVNSGWVSPTVLIEHEDKVDE
jgi:hypothetical protein